MCKIYTFGKEEVTMPIQNKWSESVHHKTDERKFESIKFTQCELYLDRNAYDEKY